MDLRSVAEKWLEGDPDPSTQAELRALLAEPDLAATDLADRFAAPLEFGTAGLRGVLGAGPNRMNRAVVLRTTWGLAQALLAENVDAVTRGVVVGFDGRTLSREFADDAAGVLAALGIRALVYPDVCPTPLAAFAVKELSTAAGIMVTASHNPPEYNGYKVFWGNGAQIIPPIDAAIAEAIARAPAACDVPRLSRAAAEAKGLRTSMPATVERAYLYAVRAIAVRDDGDRSFPIVYTPLHGVGAKVAERALEQAGFTQVLTVPEQRDPDPRFSTVTFPNPEEKGAMDLALALARKSKAELVLANDPDADRLAVAIPDRASPTGYLQLTGNQVGVLLGHYLLTEHRPNGAPPPPKRAVVASLVSSPQLGAIAKALDVVYDETLTGFKWIVNRAIELEREPGMVFVFGYEEALGYTIGDVVRDKDGISAAVMMAELVAVLRARGTTVQAELARIARKYGHYVSDQINVTMKGEGGVEKIRAMMDRLRALSPERIGALPLLSVVDVAKGTSRLVADGSETAIALPKSNVLVFELGGRSRIVARPSGTEPKIKFYFDVREPVMEDEPFAAADERARVILRGLQAAFSVLAGLT